MADQCLDVIMDTDEEWAVRIRNLKFESFNQVGAGVSGVRAQVVVHRVDGTRGAV